MVCCLRGALLLTTSDLLVSSDSVMLKYQYAILCLVELLAKGRTEQFTTPSFTCSFHGLGAVALFGSELVFNIGIIWIFDTTAYRISGSIATFIPT